jgi:hypothetical protein
MDDVNEEKRRRGRGGGDGDGGANLVSVVPS